MTTRLVTFMDENQMTRDQITRNQIPKHQEPEHQKPDAKTPGTRTPETRYQNTRKIGEYLKRERELRGISLDEVTQGTKISKRLLQYMETDQWEKLPAEIFIKGFLKSYAEFIGLSPDDILLRYQEEKALEEGKSGESNLNERGGHIIKFLLIGALIVVAVFIAFFTVKELRSPANRTISSIEAPKNVRSQGQSSHENTVEAQAANGTIE